MSSGEGRHGRGLPEILSYLPGPSAVRGKCIFPILKVSFHVECNVVLLASFNPALLSSPGTRVKSMTWEWVGKKKLILFFRLFLSSCCRELRVHRKPTRCPASSCPKFYEASFQFWGLVVTQPKESIQKVWLFLGLCITKLSCLKVYHMFSNIRIEKWSLFYIWSPVCLS